jgi:hypothetical protein
MHLQKLLIDALTVPNKLVDLLAGEPGNAQLLEYSASRGLGSDLLPSSPALPALAALSRSTSPGANCTRESKTFARS